MFVCYLAHANAGRNGFRQVGGSEVRGTGRDTGTIKHSSAVNTSDKSCVCQNFVDRTKNSIEFSSMASECPKLLLFAPKIVATDTTGQTYEILSLFRVTSVCSSRRLSLAKPVNAPNAKLQSAHCLVVACATVCVWSKLSCFSFDVSCTDVDNDGVGGGDNSTVRLPVVASLLVVQ